MEYKRGATFYHYYLIISMSKAKRWFGDFFVFVAVFFLPFPRDNKKDQEKVCEKVISLSSWSNIYFMFPLMSGRGPIFTLSNDYSSSFLFINDLVAEYFFRCSGVIFFIMWFSMIGEYYILVFSISFTRSPAGNINKLIKRKR